MCGGGGGIPRRGQCVSLCGRGSLILSFFSSHYDVIVYLPCLCRPKNVAGIYLLGGSNSLEAGKEEVFSDSACKFTGPDSIFPFAFRTHSHSLGKFIQYFVRLQ